MKGGYPDLMPDKIVEQLRSTEDERGFVRVQPIEELTPGCAVRCIGGAMVGQTGIYIGKSKHERCEVMLNILGCKRSADVPMEYLRPA